MPQNVEELIKSSAEPEVVKAVLAEIKTYGDDNRKSYDELRKNYEELKKTLDSGLGDALTEAKFKRLSEDIITRQQALDEAQVKASTDFTKRIDDLEVAFKRPGGASGGGVSEAEMKEAKDFFNSVNAAKGMGARFEDAVDSAQYKEYRKVFEKAMRFDEKRFNDLEAKAMLVGSDPDGGYVVTPQIATSILTRMFEMDPVRQLASVETISTGAIEWLVDFDESDANWEEETVATDEDTTAKLNKKRIAVYPVAARPTATQTLLEDASVNIEAWLSRKAADKFNRKEAAAFVTGNGVGKPRGFLTYDNYSTAGTDEYGKVEQIKMGNATALTADGFISVKYSLIEQFLNRGTWLMNRSTVAATMKLKDGTGEYIWKPGLIANDAASTILGLPVRMSTTMPAIAASAKSVVLADWREAYMIVDRIGITVQRDPYTKKPFIEFYFRKRVGGDVINFQAIKIGTIEA